LSLPHDGHREYIMREKAFEKYIRDNVGSWFDWSRNEDLPVERMEDIILVTDCTLVTLWAAAAFIGRSETAKTALVPQPQDSSGPSFEWAKFRVGQVLSLGTLRETWHTTVVISTRSVFSVPPFTRPALVFI